MKKFIFIFLLLKIGYGQDSVNTVKAWYETSDAMKIPKKELKSLDENYNFIYKIDEQPKNLKSKGFYSIENNPTGYFVSYFYNNTNEKLEIRTSDGSLIAVQEALNRNGEWMPIEHWSFSWCGNSYHYIILNKKEYILVPIKKYSGNFKTMVRLKIQSIKGEKFYSVPFESYIDESQFNKPTFDYNKYKKNGNVNYLD